MKKALILVAVLGLVAAANAEYRIFFTTTDGVGLTNPGLIGNPSQAITSNDQVPDYSDNLDVYDGHYVLAAGPNYADYAGQNLANPLAINQNDWIYIWGQFYNETAGAALISALLDIVDGNGVQAEAGVNVNAVWYKVDDMGNLLTGARKRWDGYSTEADNYSHFRTTSQNLSAVTANGLRNLGGTAENWNLYTGGANNGTTGRIHLLGAIQYLQGGPYTIVPHTDLNGDPIFVIGGQAIWPVVGAFPEPASLLLLGLASLLIRRR